MHPTGAPSSVQQAVIPSSFVYIGRTTSYSHTTVRRTNRDIQLQNVAPGDGLKSPKHVEHLMINKDTL